MGKQKVPLFGEDEATALFAKALALHAFRAPLEVPFHNGIVSISEKGDFSDVKVVTPSQEIHWKETQRISDKEMKALMIEVSSILFTLLSRLDDKAFQVKVVAYAHDAIVKWNEPDFLSDLRDVVMHQPPHRRDILEGIVRTIIDCEIARENAGPK
mgnify:CR=1 FL=1|jgi:hypothetical protein